MRSHSTRTQVRGIAHNYAAFTLIASAGLAISASCPGAALPVLMSEQPSGIPLAPPPGAQPGKGPGVGVPTAQPKPQPGNPNSPATPGGAPNAGTPGKRPSGAELEQVQGRLQNNELRITATSDSIPIKTLVDFLVEHSGLKNVIITDRAVVDKVIYFNQDIVLPVGSVIDFLTSVLRQNGLTLVREGDVHYIRSNAENIGIIAEHHLATTQIIPTRGLRPSSLQQAIQIALRGGTGGGAPGMPQVPGAGGGAGGPIAFLDDLGVILMTDAPDRITQVRKMVDLLVKEQGEQNVERFELTHVAASSAKQRLTELLGGGTSASGRQDPQQAAIAAAQAANGLGGGSQQALSNIASRLNPDPKSNALLFRGRPDETTFIKRLLAVIDTPNQLKGDFYRLGNLSEQLAALARREGLGEIITLPGGNNTGLAGNRRGGFNELNTAINPAGGLATNQQNQISSEGGPSIVLEPDGTGFMYYGTEAQHERMRKLAQDFEPFRDKAVPVFEFYKLRHAKAVELAGVIDSLINNQAPTGSLLGGSSNDRSRRTDSLGAAGGQDSRSTRRNRNNQDNTQFNSQRPFGSNFASQNPLNAGGDPNATELGAIQGSENVFVYGDEKNNQVVVKAPRVLQPQFAKLINRLDLRRPQVYIDAKIIAVTDNNSFRLAFETQLINMGGDARGVLNTNFGLGTFPTTGNGLQGPKTVASGLGGLTAAIIRSDQVPVIVTALASDTNARILSTPQLLVDDNESAEISSVNIVPTSATTVSNNTTLTTQGPSAEAGTTLSVTPHISEGGYLTLSYDITQSSFTGPATTTGGVTLAPPSIENSIGSDSITLPSDSTIVIGGLTVDNVSNTVIKVPFLGDLPLVGALFRDDNRTGQKTTLYVFITPRIMQDPNFYDLRLLTEGPSKLLRDLERSDVPESKPARIEIAPLPYKPNENR